jgi:hypothetical protein
MNLREILNNLDKSEPQDDIKNIATEVGVDYNNLLDVIPSPLVYYWVENWLSADKWCGTRAYFLDGEFVALSSQLGTRLDEIFKWASKKAFKDTTKYIRSIQKRQDFKNVALVDFELDMGLGYHIEYAPELLQEHTNAYLDGELVDVSRPRHNVLVKNPLQRNVAVAKQNGENVVVEIGKLIFPYCVKGQ